MSQPTFAAYYMVRRPKAVVSDHSRPLEARMGRGIHDAVDMRTQAPSRLRYPSAVRRAS